MALPRLKHQPFRGRPPQATRTEPITPGVHFGDLPGFEGAQARRRTEVDNPGFSISSRATIFGGSGQTPRSKFQRQQSNGPSLAITVSGGTSTANQESSQSSSGHHPQTAFGSQARSFGRGGAAAAHEVLDEATVRGLVGDEIEDDLKNLLAVVREDLKNLFREVDTTRAGRITHQKVKAVYRKLGDQWADEAFSFIPKHPEGPEGGAVSLDEFNAVALRMSRHFEAKEETQVQQVSQTQILLPVMTTSKIEEEEGRQRSKTLTGLGLGIAGLGKEQPHVMRGLPSARQHHERRGGIVDLDEAWTSGAGGTAAMLARAQKDQASSKGSPDSPGAAGNTLTAKGRSRARTAPFSMGSGSTSANMLAFYSSGGSSEGIAGKLSMSEGGNALTATSSASLRPSTTGNSISAAVPAAPPAPDTLASRLNILNSDAASPGALGPGDGSPRVRIGGDEAQSSSAETSSSSSSNSSDGGSSDGDGDGDGDGDRNERSNSDSNSYDGSSSGSDEDGSSAESDEEGSKASSFEGSSNSSNSSSIFDVNTERSKPGHSKRRKHHKKHRRRSMLSNTSGRSSLVVAALEAVAARQSVAETKAMEDAVWAAGSLSLPPVRRTSDPRNSIN